MSEPLFTVPSDGSTDAPSIDADEYAYVTYFENKLGEHLIFVFDEEEGEGTIYTSENNWEEVTTITRQEIMDGDFHLHFGQFEGEEKWIHAFVMAVQAREKSKSS